MKEQLNIDRCLQTTFTMAAKSFVGMVRDNNEDNFQCSSDLTKTPMQWKNNEINSLSDKGALLVVADGMGGMNAGEVASEIAINTVRDCFKSENITDETLKTRYTIERFMNGVITEADNRIKQTALQRPETKGMGTTMVIGWVQDRKLYISWCGDSRAYVFNPSKGLKRLSKDHSLVQELVDSGKISPEDAFDYPDSNVITNCLSAISQKAKPDALKMPHELEKDDVILLCSDGLCGLIRDQEIQNIISQNVDNMQQCCDNLIKAACEAGGHDNVTVALCKILTVKDPDPEQPQENFERKTWIKWGLVSVLALLIGFAIFKFLPDKTSPENNTNISDNQDTTKTDVENSEPQIEEEKTIKKYKYIYNGDSTNNVSARITKSSNLLVVADFGNGKKAEFLFGSNSENKSHFNENCTKNDSIEGAYYDEKSKKHYDIMFDVQKFKNDILSGYFIVEKNDTVFLNDVGLEKNKKSVGSSNNDNFNDKQEKLPPELPKAIDNNRENFIDSNLQKTENPFNPSQQ